MTAHRDYRPPPSSALRNSCVAIHATRDLPRAWDWRRGLIGVRSRNAPLADSLAGGGMTKNASASDLCAVAGGVTFWRFRQSLPRPRPQTRLLYFAQRVMWNPSTGSQSARRAELSAFVRAFLAGLPTPTSRSLF